MVGGTARSPLPDSPSSASISSTNSGFPAAVTCDPFPQPGVHIAARRQELVDERGSLRGLERLEQQAGGVELAAAPACPAVEQFRPRQAQDQDGRVTAESAMCSIRSREPARPSAHHRKRRRRGARSAELSKSLRTAHAISGGDVAAACSPSSTLMAAATFASRAISSAAAAHPCSVSSSCLIIDTTGQ